jgi:hypothetical protein
MKTPPNNHDHLWNDLPLEERKRLMPHAMESQLLHIWQCKQKAIAAHKKHMKELDDWMANIKRDLDKI